MDFAFSVEQDMLRETARSYLGDSLPSERLVALLGSATGWDPSSWPAMAQLGWVGLSVPETLGGAGMSFLEEAVLFEELGASLYPGPYFSTVGMALPALAGSDVLRDVIAGSTSATLAHREPRSGGLGDCGSIVAEAHEGRGGWRLSGAKVLVPDAAIAGHFVVSAQADGGTGLWRVAHGRHGCEVTSSATVDDSRRLGVVTLKDAPGELLARPGAAREVLATIRLRALAAAALEAVGVAQHALDLQVAYVRERRQFDRPIGAYQAVSHQIVDSYMATELARSLAYWAAWCVAERDEQVSAAVAAAKDQASRAALRACETGIQVHGGIGFTWEHVLHRYYKRARWLDAFEARGSDLTGTIAAGLLDS